MWYNRFMPGRTFSRQIPRRQLRRAGGAKEAYMEEFWQGIVNYFKNAGIDLLFGIIILVVGLIVVRLIKAVLKRILRRAKRDEAMSSFIVSLVNIVLEIVVLITALATMGINTASIIAVIGTCGVAIGLALKDSLGNIASGIMIIFNKPFKKDDYVEIAGEEGRITQINLFNTTLMTDDDTVIIVPNSEAVNNPIINYEGCRYRRVVVDIAVDKGSDVGAVRGIVSRVADSEPLLSQEQDYSVVMNGQDTNCVKLRTCRWTCTRAPVPIPCCLQKRVKRKSSKKRTDNAPSACMRQRPYGLCHDPRTHPFSAESISERGLLLWPPRKIRKDLSGVNFRGPRRKHFRAG